MAGCGGWEHLVEPGVNTTVRAEADQVNGARVKAWLDVLEAVTLKQGPVLEGEVDQRCTCRKLVWPRQL